MKIILFLSALFLAGCCLQDTVDTAVVADVLTIEENILDGKIIGAFLSSPSGSLSNDVIKVGVSFKVDDILFLQDLKLRHAELVYYKDHKKLKMDLRISYQAFGYCGSKTYLNGRMVFEERLSTKLSKHLVDFIKRGE